MVNGRSAPNSSGSVCTTAAARTPGVSVRRSSTRSWNRASASPLPYRSSGSASFIVRDLLGREAGTRGLCDHFEMVGAVMARGVELEEGPEIRDIRIPDPSGMTPMTVCGSLFSVSASPMMPGLPRDGSPRGHGSARPRLVPLERLRPEGTPVPVRAAHPGRRRIAPTPASRSAVQDRRRRSRCTPILGCRTPPSRRTPGGPGPPRW
jgi:hypothetical protein